MAERVEKNVGKGKIAHFPTEFSKELNTRHMKTRSWERVKTK